ncbi:CU044_5270 family protein [Streptomyces sp. NPDC007904]|uniref:CU044_5270 family protein n=1 Tax=Streptomyces sp. NPDC007904 TaxID=3364787 RepID=UPI0036E0622D
MNTHRPCDTQPDLGRWNLPPQRRSAMKADLLRRIDADVAAAPRTAVQRLLVRPVVVLPAAALAVTALVLTAVTGDSLDTPHRATGARADAAAVVWLDQAATVASRGDVPAVRDDQFVYVRSLVRDNTAAFGAPARLGPPHRREIWTVQDPDPVSRTGTLRETGPGAIMPGQTVPIVDGGRASAPGVHRPTYAWLAGLPTESGALLALLREQVVPADGQSVDHAVFDVIGELLHETIVPPPVAAALYRVAADLPGVTGGGDAVDAAGRSGIGITFDDGRSATRNEWIFDRDTFAFLGDRTYFTGRGKRPDVLFHSSAVLQRAVVDRLGEQPSGTDQ